MLFKIKISWCAVVILVFSLLTTSCDAQESNLHEKNEAYTYQEGDPNGIGKWYMGREIAHVMGYQAMAWLERPEREKEENAALLIQNMEIDSTDVIADIGAGSGYHVFKMAPLAKQAKVYAVDIQQEMLDAIQETRMERGVDNIVLVKGEEQSSNLPNATVDKVLMVDVYHEFSYPKEMLSSIYQSLKKDGRVYLIEYRKEDPTIPIKTIHKMTENQAVKEFAASGFQLVENIDNLPWQHCMVFKKQINR